MVRFEQGDCIKVEDRDNIYLVVSKNFFNETGMAMLCPVVQYGFSDPLHVEIVYEDSKAFVLCEQVRMFDLRVRGYSHQGRISYSDIIDITDAIQSIFDR